VIRLKEISPNCTISSRRSSPDVVARRIGLRSPSELFSSILAGDEVRSFKNANQQWKARVGRRGYVLIRDGRVVEAVLTGMN
jgi:hypothetical protein